MRTTAMIVALLAASFTGRSQALPSGAVPFGQQTWIGTDGSIWVGKDGNGYKQILYLNSSATIQEVETAVQFVSPGSLRVPTPTSNAMAANKQYVDNAISASLSDLTIAWADITGKPSTFTPSAHTHAAADIVSGTLNTARIPDLNASKITAGTFGIARIPTGTTGTTVALGNHTHSASDVTSGTFGIARIPTGTTSGTVALGNHTHPISAISGLQTALDGKANLTGAIFTGFVAASNFTATSSSNLSNGMNLIWNPNNAGGIVGRSGNETKFAGFEENVNEFSVGYGTTTSGVYTKKFSIDLPTGNAEFSGRVSGDDGVADNDFVTVGQLQGGGGSGALAAPKTFYVFDGEADNTADSVLLRNIDLQSDGFWKGTTADEGSRIEFEIRGSFANSGQDNYLTIHIGASPFWKKTVPQGTIPAQEFWISGTITKLSAVEIRYEIDFKCGDAGGVDFHTIETGIDNGTGDWNLETGPDAELDVITDKTFSGATVISHARFTKFPINGTYETNF